MENRTPRIVRLICPLIKVGGREKRTPETVTPPGVTTPEMKVGGRLKTAAENTLRLIWPEMNDGGRRNAPTPVTGPATTPEMKAGGLEKRTPETVWSPVVE